MISHLYLFLAIFLIATIVLGFFSGKNVKTMEDYVLANRSLNTGVLFMSLTATYIGGVHIFDASHMYSRGVIHMVEGVGCLFSFCVIGLFIAPKLVYFKKCLTLGDIIKSCYNRYISIFASLVSLSMPVLLVAVQLSVVGVIGSLFGLDKKVTILMVGFTITLYAMRGIWSVAITDVVQLVVSTFVFVLIATKVIQEVGGVGKLFSSLPVEKLKVFDHPNFFKFFKENVFWAWYPGYFLSLPFIQRMLASKNPRQIRNMWLYNVGFYGVFRLLILLIGLGAFVLYPQLNVKGLDGDVVIVHVVKKLFSSGWQPIIVIGFLCMVISTADSFLTCASTAAVHDVFKPICDRYGIRIHEIKWIKVATLCIGSMSIFVAVQGFSIGNLFFYSLAFFSSIVVPPLLVGILGFKTDAFTFYASTLGAVAIALLGCLLGWEKFFAVNCVILANFIVFFLTHYIRNDGWAILKRAKSTTEDRLFSWKKIKKAMVDYCPTPAKFIRYSRSKVHAYGEDSASFSLFLIIIYMLPFFTEAKGLNSYETMTVIRIIGVSLCSGLILKPYWPSWLRRYFAFYWHFTLAYTLPFSTTLILLITPTSIEPLFNLALSIFLLIALVDWLSFCLISLLGIIGGVLVHYNYTGSFAILEQGAHFGLLVYTIFFSVLIGLLFARRKQRYNTNQLDKSKLYAGSIAHKAKSSLGVSLFAGQRIKEALQGGEVKFSEKNNNYIMPKKFYDELAFFGSELEKSASENTSRMNMFMDTLKTNISSKIQVCSIKACVEEALKDRYFQDEDIKKKVLLKLDDDFEARVDPRFFNNIIYNLVNNAISHGKCSLVELSLDPIKRVLCVKDDGEGISSSILPYVFDLFHHNSLQSSGGIGLALIKVLLGVYDCDIHCTSKEGQNSYTKLTITFPGL